jgi:hypothetical protein
MNKISANRWGDIPERYNGFVFFPKTIVFFINGLVKIKMYKNICHIDCNNEQYDCYVDGKYIRREDFLNEIRRYDNYDEIFAIIFSGKFGSNEL